MEPYKFGFNVFNYPPEKFLEYSRDNSLTHIEINLSQKHSSISSFDEQRIENLKSFASENGIQFSFHLPYETNIADNIFSLSNSNSRYMCKAIELAGKLGAGIITSHMGFFFWFPVEKWQREKALLRFVNRMKKIIDKCHKAGVILALENVTPLPPGTDHLLLGDNPGDFDYVFEELNSPYIRFCLDTGHANIGEGALTYLERFKEKLVNVHYHDNNGKDDEHLPVGEGNINWEALTGKFKEIGYNGPFISECRNLRPHEASEKLKKYLVQSFG